MICIDKEEIDLNYYNSNPEKIVDVFKKYNTDTSIFIINEESFTPEPNTLRINQYYGQLKDTCLNIISDYLQYIYDIDCDDVKMHLGVIQKKLSRMQQNLLNASNNATILSSSVNN